MKRFHRLAAGVDDGREPELRCCLLTSLVLDEARKLLTSATIPVKHLIRYMLVVTRFATTPSANLAAGCSLPVPRRSLCRGNGGRRPDQAGSRQRFQMAAGSSSVRGGGVGEFERPRRRVSRDHGARTAFTASWEAVVQSSCATSRTAVCAFHRAHTPGTALCR